MTGAIDKRTNDGYEIQFYKSDGNNGRVVKFYNDTEQETIEELARYLATMFWSNAYKDRPQPTVWHNGKPFRNEK